METDSGDGAEYTALAHQSEPMRIKGRGATQDSLPAAVLNPMRGAPHHFAELQPILVISPVPIEQIVGLVPQLDMMEMVAIT